MDGTFNFARTVANAVSRWLNYKKKVNANSIGGIEIRKLSFSTSPRISPNTILCLQSDNFIPQQFIKNKYNIKELNEQSKIDNTLKPRASLT